METFLLNLARKLNFTKSNHNFRLTDYAGKLKY